MTQKVEIPSTDQDGQPTIDGRLLAVEIQLELIGRQVADILAALTALLKPEAPPIDELAHCRNSCSEE